MEHSMWYSMATLGFLFPLKLEVHRGYSTPITMGANVTWKKNTQILISTSWWRTDKSSTENTGQGPT